MLTANEITNHKMNRLNFRQIIMHFIATWFFMYAFQTLFSLHETKMINIYREVDRSRIFYEFVKQGITGGDLVNFSLWTNVGKTVGLLIAFILSLSSSIKAGWFWVNSLVILILAYCLAWTEFLGLDLLTNIYYLKALTFIHINLLLIILSIIFSFFGLLTFFHPRTHQFISPSTNAT
jgi:hypothetical protein